MSTAATDNNAEPTEATSMADAEGHIFRVRWTGRPPGDDTEGHRLHGTLRPVRDDDNDTEGHGFKGTWAQEALQVEAEDTEGHRYSGWLTPLGDDDTEGHIVRYKW